MYLQLSKSLHVTQLLETVSKAMQEMLCSLIAYSLESLPMIWLLKRICRLGADQYDPKKVHKQVFSSFDIARRKSLW